MRTTYAVIIVAAAALIVVQGTKTLLVSPKAEATFVPAGSMSLEEIQRNARDLPVQDIADPI
jgi:hypothetical protein